MSESNVCEFWVMRVLLHPGPQRQGRKEPVHLEDMDLTAKAATLALVSAGSLCCLPDGCIAEPTEVFDHQDDAHNHRAKLMREFPREDFRVVVNTSITV